MTVKELIEALSKLPNEDKDKIVELYDTEELEYTEVSEIRSFRTKVVLN